MVTRFGPWVGKENMHAIQGFIGDHFAQHFHSIVVHDTNVGDCGFIYYFKQIANAGGMHINGQEVFFRHLLRNDKGGLSHAKANF